MALTELYVVRHGLAASERHDPERRLTSEGRAQVERAATVLAGAQIGIDVMYHSGKARAEETAEILAGALQPVAGVRWRRGLGPADSVEEFVSELEEEDHDRVMLVGHLPFVEKLLALLLASKTDPPVVRCSEACVAALVRAEDGWRLRWMLDPTLVEF